ncbi:MAG: hypothetical protein NC489_08525 [Ruminococcus flavefaciens]|nr:hypothetical protein [Ruminococcus flavefaciens]
MDIVSVRNDASEGTLTIKDFTQRHYHIRGATSLIVSHYEGFQGRILEIHQCNEEMDDDVVTRLVDMLVRKYSAPDTDVSMVSDNGDLGNTGVVEVVATQVLNWVLRNNELSDPGCKRIIIIKKHRRDGYIESILDLAQKTE